MSKKTINDGRGRSYAPWGWRMGEVESNIGSLTAGQDDYLVRIYCVKYESKEDLDREATKIFAIVRGATEEQCFNRGHVLMKQCLEGVFDDL